MGQKEEVKETEGSFKSPARTGDGDSAFTVSKSQSATRDIPALVDQEKNRLRDFKHKFMNYDQADESNWRCPS